MGSPWTHFWDMHSGGNQKLQWAHVFIEAPEDEARKLFAEAFGRDPDGETCNCCGGDYSITEEPTLEQATAYQRHLRYASPVGWKRWRTATVEERQHANEVGRYLEPDEQMPEGWADGAPNSAVELGYDKPMSFDDFMADPHFDGIGPQARGVHSCSTAGPFIPERDTLK